MTSGGEEGKNEVKRPRQQQLLGLDQKPVAGKGVCHAFFTVGRIISLNPKMRELGQPYIHRQVPPHLFTTVIHL